MSFVDHEDVIGVYNVGTTDAKTLAAAIKDVLLRMGLSIDFCRSQCYDGAANMTGSKSGVATLLLNNHELSWLTAMDMP